MAVGRGGGRASDKNVKQTPRAKSDYISCVVIETISNLDIAYKLVYQQYMCV